MAGKIIELNCTAADVDTVLDEAKEDFTTILAVDYIGAQKLRATIRLFVDDKAVQAVLDKLQTLLHPESEALFLLVPVDAQIGGQGNLSKTETDQVAATREELFTEISRSTELDFNFVLLAVLSTIVAAIGLIENDIAVVIGAMVIAPLLGPNLGLALGAALGDKELMKAAIITNATGLFLTVGLGFLVVLVWPTELDSHEILSRTVVKPGNVLLALAAGIAAVQSLTTRLASLLVGVMVAVALVPPATVLGMMLGIQEWDLATGAAVLLAVNIAAVNLSAQLVFLFRGIRPRTWIEQRAAKEASWINILIWIILLILCTALIFIIRE